MTKRNYGVDVLRILAMFFVVVLHNLGQGGILNHVELSTPDWWGTYLLENLAVVAVNVFAMITGFLSVGHHTKSMRVTGIMIQATFWAVVTTLIVLGLGIHLTHNQLLHFGVPIYGYWYVRAYLGMILLSPVLSLAASHLSQQLYGRMLAALLVVSVTLGWLNQFYLLNGYSAYWLIVMYFVGGYLRLYANFRHSAYAYLGMYFGLAVLTTLAQYLLARLGHGSGSLTSYVGPLVVLQSIALMKMGLSLSVRSSKLRSGLQWASTVAFGVYLVDASGVVYNLFIPHVSSYLVGMSGPVWIWIILLSILMFMAFMLADWIRLMLFKWVKIDVFTHWLDSKAKCLFDYFALLLQR